MMPRPLSTVLTMDRADQIIALRDGQTFSLARFAADARGVSGRAATQKYRRAALVCRGSYAFTVGLFGLLGNDVEIVLPPNGQIGTLESLRGQFDVLVDDAFVDASEPAADGAVIPLNATRPSLRFFTSGSTGAPKRIEKTLAMLDREIAALDSLWGATIGHGPVYATVPHQHIYGLTFKILWPLASGRAFADETDDLWETLLTKLTADATLVSGPAHLGRIAGLAPLPATRAPRRVFSAGAPLSYDAAAEAKAILGRQPTEIFGSTETGAIATREQAVPDEAWTPLPGIAIRPCDDDGRLSLRSPWVSEDWFDTDDLIAPVEHGFRFRGRADRIVKIEGKRISLPEIEQNLCRLPWITLAAATLVPGSPARLAAAVVLNGQGRERLAVVGGFRFGRLLRAALADTQEAAGMPRLWRFVDALPSSDGLGKRRDADIRALFEMTP